MFIQVYWSRLALVGCVFAPIGFSQQRPTSDSAQTGRAQADRAADVVKRIPAGKEFSGFLKDYTHLKPNPNLDGAALTYAKADSQKNLHRYIGIIVDPVDVYVSTNTVDAKLPEKARQSAASYFQNALVKAVSTAFPVADEGGPLVLRLRAALIGVDAGG